MLMNSGGHSTGKEMINSIKGKDMPGSMLPLHQTPITSIIHPLPYPHHILTTLTLHNLITIIIKPPQWG
jgi:hypothetical protein